MNITIDPTIPGALGSFGYDDEGTPAAPRDAVRNGTWVASSPDGTRPRWPGSTTPAASAPTGGPDCRWCG